MFNFSVRSTDIKTSLIDDTPLNTSFLVSKLLQLLSEFLISLPCSASLATGIATIH